jgi:hypothetical protein
VNDLAFVGCINAAGLLSRTSPDLVQDPKAEYPILTDGNIAVVRLNDCIDPNLMEGVTTSAVHQPRRVTRALTAIRNDFVRSNIIFTTYNTLKLFGKRKTEPTSTHTGPVNGEPRGLDWLTPAAPLGTCPEQ